VLWESADDAQPTLAQEIARFAAGPICCRTQRSLLAMAQFVSLLTGSHGDGSGLRAQILVLLRSAFGVGDVG